VDSDVIVLVLLIGLLLILGTGLWLAARRTGDEAKRREYLFWSDQAVAAAEQLYWLNNERLEYALGWLDERFPALPVDEARMLVEAAVLRLKQQREGGRGPVS